MYYLDVIEAACLKIFIAIFYFCHSKNPSNIMKNILYIMRKNSISVYSLKSISFLTNVRNKRVYKENKSQFFDVMKNDLSPSKGI